MARNKLQVLLILALPLSLPHCSKGYPIYPVVQKSSLTIFLLFHPTSCKHQQVLLVLSLKICKIEPLLTISTTTSFLFFFFLASGFICLGVCLVPQTILESLGLPEIIISCSGYMRAAAQLNSARLHWDELSSTCLQSTQAEGHTILMKSRNSGAAGLNH